MPGHKHLRTILLAGVLLNAPQLSAATPFDAVAAEAIAKANDLVAAQRYAEAGAVFDAVMAQKEKISAALLEQARLGKMRAEIGKALAHAPAAAAAAPPFDAEARQAIAKGNELLKEERYDEAGAVFDVAIAQKDKISAALLTEAARGKMQADVGKAPNRTSAFAQFWNSLATGVTTMAVWLFYFAIAAGVAALAVLIVRLGVPVQGGRLVAIQDLTASDRESASRILTRQVMERLGPPPRRASADILFEAVGDMEGATAGSQRPMGDLSGMDALISSSASISFGPFSVTPKAIWNALVSLRTERYEETLSGALSSAGDRTVLVVQKLNKDGRPVAEGYWRAEASGTDARRTVLREVAARVICDHGKSLSTRDWRSLVAFQTGMDQIADSDSPDSLRKACDAFDAALRFDPDNWLARFNFSLVNRQLGQYEEAVQNCRYLEHLLDRKVPKSLLDYVGEHSDFPGAIRYNRALALTRISGWDSGNEAIQILQELHEGSGSAGPQLKVLAQSACAAALVEEYYRLRNEIGDDADSRARTQVRLDALRERISKIVDALKPDGPGATSLTEALARAVALNAHGLISVATGKYDDAIADFRQSIVLNSNFGEPHSNLARTLRRRRRANWVVDARVHLLRALQLNPANRDANYQMGRLQSDDAVGDYPAALEYFAKAAPHSWAAYQAAEIYLNPEFGGLSTAHALEQLRASVRLSDVVDQRAIRLGQVLVDAASVEIEHAKSQDPAEAAAARQARDRASGLLKQAEAAATRVQKRAEKESDRKRGADLLERVRNKAIELQPPLTVSVGGGQQ